MQHQSLNTLTKSTKHLTKFFHKSSWRATRPALIVLAGCLPCLVLGSPELGAADFQLTLARFIVIPEV